MDIEVRILASTGDRRYPVEASLNDGAFASGHFFTLTEEAALALLRTEHSAQEYGTLLGKMLLGEAEIRDLFIRAYGASVAKGASLRFRLVIDAGAAELHRFAWERLYVGIAGRTIALSCSTSVPFSRYTALSIADPVPVQERPLRVIIAVSNPRDLPPGLVPIEVEKEIRSIQEALRNVPDLDITVMPGRTGLSAEYQAELSKAGFRIVARSTTPETLKEHIERERAHVVHFLGHGFYRNGVSALFLEDQATGSTVPVRDSDLVPVLEKLDPLPQLVFLAACESATRSETDTHPFVGLGPKLVEAGFPAVVAMQAKVPMDMATKLTASFYRELLANGVVDVALNRSRGMLFSAQHADWAIPVLFSRVRNGQLFGANPVRMAVKAMMDSPAFQPVDMLPDPLPLEVIVFDGQPMPEDWESVAQQSQSPTDLWKSLDDILEPDTPGIRMALVGARGSFKTGVCRKLAADTARASLSQTETVTFPVYVDLTRYSAVRSKLLDVRPLHALLQESIDQHAGVDFDHTKLERLLVYERLRIRFIFDNGDDLPGEDRTQLIEEIRDFALAHPRHQFVFSMEVRCWNPLQFSPSHLLSLSPLTQTKIERYLKSIPAHWANELNERLVQNSLFDLTSMPWLFLRISSEARKSIFPESRWRVLAGLVDREIRCIPIERGQQARAFMSLAALAREMHLQRSNTVPVAQAFRIFNEVRSNREYNLEELLDRFIERGVLKRTSGEHVGFAFPAFQAYCCAADFRDRPRQAEWETISASVGQPLVLQWWEDALILYSGMCKDKEDALESLVGAGSLRLSDRLFLASRCLLESGLPLHSEGIAGDIFDALVWRTDAGNERSAWKRLRAVRTLGQFRNPATISYLARIAIHQIRPVGGGKFDYDYGQIRQAAGRALRRHRPYFPKEIDQQSATLGILLDFWRADEYPRLSAILNGKDPEITDPALRGLAAFALADLSREYRNGEDALVAAFLNHELDINTLWSITDALILLDPGFVLYNAIYPFLDESLNLRETHPQVWASKHDWNALLVYIIGQIHTSDERARRFVESFLENSRAELSMQGRALAALGSMSAMARRADLEKIAMGDVSSIAGAVCRPDSEKDYLRRKALEALGRVGNRDILNNLRRQRDSWTPEFERTFQSVSEEIQLRARGGTRRT